MESNVSLFVLGVSIGLSLGSISWAGGFIASQCIHFFKTVSR